MAKVFCGWCGFDEDMPKGEGKTVGLAARDWHFAQEGKACKDGLLHIIKSKKLSEDAEELVLSVLGGDVVFREIFSPEDDNAS